MACIWRECDHCLKGITSCNDYPDSYGDVVLEKGVGNISFKTYHGDVTLTGVLNVPGLDRNVISVPQIAPKGLKIRMLKDKSVISGRQGHVMTVKKSGSFHLINVTLPKKSNHSVLLIRKLDRNVKEFTWISKSR
jgi:hypothetical protein